MSKVFTTKNVTRIAILSALSAVLYIFIKFPLPFMFPSFLDFQISEMPALLAGYMMGPIGGSIVILIKTLIKLPFTSTAGVGELGDFLIGITFVVSSSLIYRKFRTKKGALISLIVGTACCTVVSLLINAFILVPFYANAFGMSAIIGMMAGLFPNITEKTLMLYYLPLSVLPFNLLRCIISSVITFLVYKKLARLFDLMFEPKLNYLIIGGKKCILNNVLSTSEKATFKLGCRLGKMLTGGEIILLSGELGAGKTVFTQGIARGLGIKDEVLSPTFTLMNCYEGRLKLYHYDAYRLSGGEQAEEKGLTEFFGQKDAVCVIEWAENIIDAIPSEHIEIEIKYEGEGRRITVLDKRNAEQPISDLNLVETVESSSEIAIDGTIENTSEKGGQNAHEIEKTDGTIGEEKC